MTRDAFIGNGCPYNCLDQLRRGSLNIGFVLIIWNGCTVLGHAQAERFTLSQTEESGNCSKRFQYTSLHYPRDQQFSEAAASLILIKVVSFKDRINLIICQPKIFNKLSSLFFVGRNPQCKSSCFPSSQLNKRLIWGRDKKHNTWSYELHKNQQSYLNFFGKKLLSV